MTGQKEIIYCDFYHFYYSSSNRVDLKNQYLNLLSELTTTIDIDDMLFESNLNKINSIGKIIIGYVLDDNENENKDENKDKTVELVGTGTIIIEPKIIRGGMCVGHIEDIVVKSNYRGKKISTGILNKLNEFASKSNCYKVILDCVESIEHVYKSNGFEIKGLQMGKYFI